MKKEKNACITTRAICTELDGSFAWNHAEIKLVQAALLLFENVNYKKHACALHDTMEVAGT